LTTALLFLTDLSRSAAVARTRSTHPPHLSPALWSGTGSIWGFCPGHRKSLSQTPWFWRGLSSST